MSKFKEGDYVWLGRDLHKVEAVMPDDKYQLDGVLTYIPENWLEPFVDTRTESDLRISEAKLRDILEDVASSQFVPRVLSDDTVDEIINQVKRSI